MNNKTEHLIMLIIAILTVTATVCMYETVKRNSYEAGYQACVEEYNLYLPYEY